MLNQQQLLLHSAGVAPTQFADYSPYQASDHVSSADGSIRLAMSWGDMVVDCDAASCCSTTAGGDGPTSVTSVDDQPPKGELVHALEALTLEVDAIVC